MGRWTDQGYEDEVMSKIKTLFEQTSEKINKDAPVSFEYQDFIKILCTDDTFFKLNIEPIIKDAAAKYFFKIKASSAHSRPAPYISIPRLTSRSVRRRNFLERFPSNNSGVLDLEDCFNDLDWVLSDLVQRRESMSSNDGQSSTSNDTQSSSNALNHEPLVTLLSRNASDSSTTSSQREGASRTRSFLRQNFSFRRNFEPLARLSSGLESTSSPFLRALVEGASRAQPTTTTQSSTVRIRQRPRASSDVTHRHPSHSLLESVFVVPVSTAPAASILPLSVLDRMTEQESRQDRLQEALGSLDRL